MTAKLRLLGQLLCAVSAVLYVVWATGGGWGRAAAASDASPIGLTVSTQQRVESGDPVMLDLTVRNQSSRPCVLSAQPNGTVTLDLRRDGVRVTSQLAPADLTDGVRGLVQDRAQTVQPGGSVSFRLSSLA
ncbi:MAG: hypothetical protein HOV83_32955, partial [Catenulispora sp.]|nr:hypothetical protein [Catenulispora sp.]